MAFATTQKNKTVESLQQLYFCKLKERAAMPAPELVVVWEKPHTWDLECLSERVILFSLVDNDQLSVAHNLLRIVGRISRVMLHVGLCVF